MGNTKSTSMNSPRSRRLSSLLSETASDSFSAPPPYSDVVEAPLPEIPTGSSYTRVDHVPPPSHTHTHDRGSFNGQSLENVLEMLRKFNTVIVVDDSGSMRGERWKEARNALASLAHTAAKYDADGIDVYFLNDQHVGSNMKSSTAVKRLFDDVRPTGITPIGEKLEELLLEYLSMLDNAKDTGDPAVLKTVKPINYIVITDGAPTDDPEAVIVTAAKRLDARNYPLTQVGIQFVQIGDSASATTYLNELDDALSTNNGVRDMVDTTPYSGGPLSSELLIKILLGGINRRVDRRGADSVV